MSKRQDDFYFEQFVISSGCACEAARLLKNNLEDFKPDKLAGQLDEMHETEHRADKVKHETMDRLMKAFITPIEREDIVEMSHYIDDITDKIEDVLIRVYINNVSSVKSDALELLDIVIKCCDEVHSMLKEFHDFKNSRKLKQFIININSYEEEADRAYISSMRKLHTQESDALLIIAWREIYSYLEKCADACEHVADVVDSVIMKNS